VTSLIFDSKTVQHGCVGGNFGLVSVR